MRSVDSTSYMFVLTDGLYEKDQKELIKKHVASCAQNGIATFGIGIGIYPNGIDELFPNVIFSPNPNHLINGIASFFENEAGESYDNTIKVIMPEKIDDRQITHVFQFFNRKPRKYCIYLPVDTRLPNSATFFVASRFTSAVFIGHDSIQSPNRRLIQESGELSDIARLSTENVRLKKENE